MYQMNFAAFKDSLQAPAPPADLPPAVEALWWDARGDWSRAHSLIDHLESPSAMAVHAYLHRKEGDAGNAGYWYRLAGRRYHRAALDDEWQALAEGLLAEN